MTFGRLEEVHVNGAWPGGKHPADGGANLPDKAFCLVGGFQNAGHSQEGGKESKDGRIGGAFGQKELPVLECPPERQAHPREMHESIRVAKSGDRLQGTGDREPIGNWVTW